MQRIGLTGGIAAGKSVASTRFTELGAVVIDHDVLAREAVAPGSVGLDAVIDAFGPGVLRSDGELDRAALAALVFGDDAARARLDAAVHPSIARLAAERDAAAGALDANAVVVHDIPLLVETGQGADFHVVVVVHAPREQRLNRLVTGRGLTALDAASRIDAQASDDERLAAADLVLDGSGSESHLRSQVDALWQRLEQQAAEEGSVELL